MPSKASVPNGLAAIVNAVVAAYLARQQGEELNGSDQRVQLLIDRRAQLELQIEARRKQESQLAGELGVSTFAPGFASPYDKMVGDASAALFAASRNLIEVQARLTALLDHQQRMNRLEVDSDAQQMLAGDHDLTGANAALMAQRQAAVVQLQGLGRNHPGRPALEEEIKNIDRTVAQSNSTAMHSLRGMLLQNRDTKERQEASAAQARVDEARLTTDGINQEVNKLRASSAIFGAKYNQALSNSDEIARLQKDIQTIDDRVNFLRLEAPSPGFVRIGSPAQTPDIALKGGRRKIFGLFLFAALVLALALPTGIDLVDPKIKTCGELEALLGFAPLGLVEEGSGRIARESLRRVAFAIIREWRASGVRSFVLVPVRDRAGTTALALALARELSRLGKPAVAIEGNQFAPDRRYRARHESVQEDAGQHNGARSIKGVSGSQGDGSSASPSRFSIEPRSHSIVDADGLLPARIPICRHLNGPGLTLECIESLIALALATNDLVILDAPGLLNSADAEMLIQMPAAALLVVRQDRDLMPEVIAAARTLEKLSPPVVGAILNGIARDEGSLNQRPLRATAAPAVDSRSPAVVEANLA